MKKIRLWDALLGANCILVVHSAVEFAITGSLAQAALGVLAGTAVSICWSYIQAED